jgi:hypothetical protein
VGKPPIVGAARSAPHPAPFDPIEPVAPEKGLNPRSRYRFAVAGAGA